MNPIVFARRRPVTTLMLVVALVSGGVLGLSTDAGRYLLRRSTRLKFTPILIYIGTSATQMKGVHRRPV